MVVLISLNTNGPCYNTCCLDYLSPVLGSSTKLGTYYSLVSSATELHIQLGFQSQSIPCKNPRSTTLLKQLILNGEHQGFILTVIVLSLGFLPLFMLSIFPCSMLHLLFFLIGQLRSKHTRGITPRLS